MSESEYRETMLQFVMQRVSVDDANRCWLWKGTLNGRGYGVMKFRGKDFRAHRFVYELLASPIPEGLTLDHLCRVTSCVNPGHMDPVTLSENVLRGNGPCAVNRRKTHCINGHEFNEKNTRRSGRRRVCRACDNAKSLSKYRARAARRRAMESQ